MLAAAKILVAHGNEQAMEGKGIDIEIRDEERRTPLLAAAERASLENTSNRKYLPVNQSHEEKIVNNRKRMNELITWLVKEAGADIHARDDKGKSAADLYRNLENDEDHEVLRLLKGE